MRSRKGSRRIVVGKVEYRWQAKGDDGFIQIGIWPVNNIGPYLQANLRHHETLLKTGEGAWSSAGDQIVVTSRTIRQIIEHAISKYGYDPLVKCADLNLFSVDDVVSWQSADRANRRVLSEVTVAAAKSRPLSKRKSPHSRRTGKNRNEPVQRASFKVRAAGIAGHELRKALKARYCSREKTGFPWQRKDGPGYTIWISDFTLADSRAVPPIWEVRVESLTPLNPAGEACWREVCQGIETLIQTCGLDRIEDPLEANNGLRP